jgi:hypothetical protein
VVRSPNQAAIDKLKSILEDGELREREYLIAHIEALIPTSEAVRDYLHMAQIHPINYPGVDPSDPSIPYRSRRWRASQLVRNLVRHESYERVCMKVRKVPSKETSSTSNTQQHNNTKAGTGNGSK